MAARRLSLKSEIILVFVGMLIFDFGYFYNKLKDVGNNNLVHSMKSVSLVYPALYLMIAILISIYRVYRYNRKSN